MLRPPPSSWFYSRHDLLASDFGEYRILEELVVALEDAGLNRDAARVLRDNLVCVELSSMCRCAACDRRGFCERATNVYHVMMSDICCVMTPL
jgi:hypothetical protein